jgi:hypothetical protein
MSIEQIVAVGRVIERLLICTCGGVSLVLGWNLFRVGVVTQQAADLSAKGWHLNLKKVGLGVFFALFGAAILSISLRSPINLSLPPTSRNNTGHQEAVSDEKKPDSIVTYGHGDDPELTKTWGASINTITYIVTKDKLSTLAEQQAVERSEKSLAQLRDFFVIRQFGADLFRDYQVYKKTKALNPSKVTEQDRRHFAGIDAWLQADRIQQ